MKSNKKVIAVGCYHGVSDEFSDALTIGFGCYREAKREIALMKLPTNNG